MPSAAQAIHDRIAASDAVVIASGAHNSVIIPFPGHERLVKGLDFLVHGAAYAQSSRVARASSALPR